MFLCSDSLIDLMRSKINEITDRSVFEGMNINCRPSVLLKFLRASKYHNSQNVMMALVFGS